MVIKYILEEINVKLNIKEINGLFVFVLFSTMFVFWSLGIVWLLALFSIGLMFNFSKSKILFNQPYHIHLLPILLVTIFCLLMTNMLIRDGFNIDRFGLALGILFSSAIYYNILVYGISSKWVQLGILLAGIVGGLAGLYQYVELGIPRPGTLYSAMVFGIMGSLLIVVLGINLITHFKTHTWIQLIAVLFAFLLSISILVVSQSRSGYLFLATYVGFAFIYNKAWQYKLVNIGLIIVMLLSLSALYLAKDTSLVKRFNRGIDTSIAYMQGNTKVKSSTTVRFEMWMAGFEAFKLHPILGLGNVKIVSEMSQIRDNNQYYKSVTGEGHLHSDYFDSLARYGLVGFICYLLIYGIALRVIHRSQLLSLPERMGAFSLVIGFLVFGLTTTNYSYILTQIFIFIGIPMLVAWIKHLEMESETS